MSLYSSRALSAFGHMGQAFGAGGQNVIFGPFAFTAPFSYRDFMGTEHFLGKVKTYTPLTWQPPTTVVLSRAGQVWAVWEAAADAGSAAATKFIQTNSQKLNEFIARVDPLAYQQDMFGNFPVDTDLQRYEIFRLIKALVLTVANSGTAATAAYNAVAGGTGGSTSDLPDLSQRSSGMTAGGGGLPTAGGVKAEEETPWLLYAGLGVGGLVLVGGLFFLMKPKAKVAGYRRRRR
jgi:hypothetical protein